MAIAIPIAILLSRQASRRSDDEQGSVNFPWLHLFGALLVGYFLIVFFYSGNFLNPRGLLGIFETFRPGPRPESIRRVTANQAMTFSRWCRIRFGISDRLPLSLD